MQNSRQRRSPLSLGDSARWSAYAAAGVAGAIGVTQSAEAAITVVNINETVNGSALATNSASSFLDTAVGSLGGGFVIGGHFGTSASNSGIALMAGNAAAAFSFAGFSAGSFPYLSNLNFGDNVSTQNFGVVGNAQLNTASTATVSFARTATMAFRGGFANSEFLAAGEGYFAFRFDNGGGTQFGWGRVTMSGSSQNSYVFHEIAHGDVGEAITVGQVPEPGSLGLLALGAVGLMGWRKRRDEAA